MTDHTWSYTFDHSELARLLEYTVHRGDCDLVVYRTDDRPRCSCGLSAAMEPIRLQSSMVPSPERLANNPRVFYIGNRSLPAWLIGLVPSKYRPLTHRNPYSPTERSDG